jgi:glucuronate isomerase
MSSSLRQSILDELEKIELIDPHTHINPHSPAAEHLADILGYHYYTELAHSAGLPRAEIEAEHLEPRDRVRLLVEHLEPLENTVQYSWLIEICQRFFEMREDRLHRGNWEAVCEAADAKAARADWADTVLAESNVGAVFLTNDFDDPLEGFDTRKYVPCLRTDDLVFHLAKTSVRERLAACSGHEVTDLSSLRAALEQRFEHFVGHGARACAISLPPDFSPAPVADGRAATALESVLRSAESADEAQRRALAQRVFWTLAELCDAHRLPFDLMIGVNRGVYPGGVHQGRDLYDSRVSLIQYAQLFNAFPGVTFPISVLASVTNQELVSYAWIFPNVVTNGHWWYSNTPAFIERDAAARLEAVPQTKQIGYYSDAYKLEFVAPKFAMYRRCLAEVLATTFVRDQRWSEQRAIALGRRVLRDNVEAIFSIGE